MRAGSTRPQPIDERPPGRLGRAEARWWGARAQRSSALLTGTLPDGRVILAIPTGTAAVVLDPAEVARLVGLALGPAVGRVVGSDVVSESSPT